MRTVKHQLIIHKEKNIQSTELSKLMEVMYAYQFEKNYFSDQLLNRSNKASLINLQSSYIQIRNKLVKNNYQSKYNLPARLWKMALKEAYELHVRTHESQVALIKKNINNKIYQFCNFELTKQNKISSDSEYKAESNDNVNIVQSFEKFLYFVTNSLFFNFKTFCQFEARYFSKKFKRSKAKIYQRAKPILLDLLKPSNAVKKEVLTKEEAKQLTQCLKLESNLILNKFFEYYCHCLVHAIQKFRSFKQIQSKINPTITLDGDCYNLYSEYDNEAKKNRWFLDVMSMESGKRIKGFELTGFHYAKQIMKHRKSANLTISFDANNLGDENCVFAHFTFPVRPVKTKKKFKKSKPYKHLGQNKTSKQITDVLSMDTELRLSTMLTVGGDFGLTESFIFSDGWVAGRKQGEILKEIAESTKQAVKNIQKYSKDGCFGLEKNNVDGKRNHQRNDFNHNSVRKNINKKYRIKQKKYNSKLETYKYQFMNDIIHHFTSNNIYGQYENISESNKLTLVFEDLDYINLGRNKKQKRQINLIKGVLNLLEEKIKLHNLPIEIIYVNPAYTSQTCPNCSFVAKKNRDYQARQFRCQHCGFTAKDDVRYQDLTKVIPKGQTSSLLPDEDDYVASQNIAVRPSVLQDSQRLRVRKIKDLLLARHEQIKGSCKIFGLPNDSDDSNSSDQQ